MLERDLGLPIAEAIAETLLEVRGLEGSEAEVSTRLQETGTEVSS
jgi:hypothetical protein